MGYRIQSFAAVVGGVLSFVFGELTPAFAVLIALMVIDFFTGLLHAVIERRLNSKTCARGIMKKIFILALVAVAHLIDVSLGKAVCMGVVEFFYIANEAMSIIENAGRAGLPVPKKLTEVLEQLNGKEGNL